MRALLLILLFPVMSFCQIGDSLSLIMSEYRLTVEDVASCMKISKEDVVNILADEATPADPIRLQPCLGAWVAFENGNLVLRRGRNWRGTIHYRNYEIEFAFVNADRAAWTREMLFQKLATYIDLCYRADSEPILEELYYLTLPRAESHWFGLTKK